MSLKMLPGSLSFAAREWIWPATALFLVGLFFIFRSYAGTGLSTLPRTLSFFLKALGLALLVSILLEPTWTTTRPREGANLFAVVADNSMGLQLRDSGKKKTRSEILRDILTSDQSSWQGKLEETFMLRRYVFDSRLESARDFAQLNFQGRATALGGALKSLSERFQGQPLAGVLLFTDGNATDLENGFYELPGLPPVFPVLIGENSDLSDIALENVSATQTVFEDAPVTLTGNIKASGFDNEKLTAQVILKGKVVAEQSITVRHDAPQIPLRFELRPEEPGILFYNLRVAHANDLKNNTNLTEATLFNNDRLVAVDRGRGPYRILYIGGRPNWDYKFLNRAVSEDPELQLVSIIRMARREPKFVFRGRAGESSNPLFRGFNKTSEETERYDQPVLIRLNTKDENELRGGFPKAGEDLYGFVGLVVDDLEAEFFSPDQLMLMQRYVSERGGGFLMLGGADSLENGKYLRTPVGDMLPVYLDRLPNALAASEYRVDLTREGWLHPWIRLRSTENEERSRLEAVPGYQVLNQFREIKPGATVLATATDPLGHRYPAIASQRFGNGRVGMVALGDLFHGGLGDEKRLDDLGKAWRQMLRWLIADVPAQCEIRSQVAAGEESSILLMVKARDKKFEPLENATVQITITSPEREGGTNRVVITAEASDKEPGYYRATYVPREPGAYHASAMITDLNGLKVAEVETGWTSEPLAKEFASLSPNRPLLEDIARKTGGTVLAPGKLDEFVASLDKKKAPITETYSYPLWHKPLIFLAALSCFALEWGIRRWKGLA
jgi:hypothetical protein